MKSIHITIAATIYLYIFNILINDNTISTIIFGSWVAIVFLLLLHFFSIFGTYIHKIVTSIALTIGSTSLYFKYFYKISATEDIIFSGLVNDTGLTLELISINLVLWISLTALLPIYYLWKITTIQESISEKIKYFAITITLSIGLIVTIFYLLDLQLNKKGSIRDPKIALSVQQFSPIDIIFFYSRAYKVYTKHNHSLQNIEDLSKKYNYSLNKDIKDTTVVFILGETARSDHFAVNGYEINTTPRLLKTSNLFNFTNAVSCDTITVRSLSCIFSRMNKDNRSLFPTESSFVEILRKLGFNTSVFSLQGYQAFYEYLTYDQLVSKYTVINKANNGKAYDTSLLPYIDEVLSKKHNNRFILLHTLGSHYSYSDRFQHNDAKFKPFCKSNDLMNCSKKEIINAYDNTIYETDRFISDVINRLNGRKSMVFYISDHGESLGESDQYLHGVNPEFAPIEQFKIPFMVWLSPEFLYTNTGKKIHESLVTVDKNSSVSHDNIFHSVLGCIGVISNNGGIDNKLNLCKTKQ